MARNNLLAFISTSALASGMIAVDNSGDVLCGAYDPNDPADKKIVDDAVASALATAAEEHEAEVERLTNKNTELLGKLRKARTGGEGGVDTAEIERLEGQLETAQGELRAAQSELRTAQRDLRTVTAERDTLRTTADKESAFSSNLLTENALTSALVEANVAPHFMEAAKALLGKGVKVEVNGEERTVIAANGKSVKDFVTEWASGDAGKHYIQAPANGGGGATGANGGGTGTKKLSEMTEGDRLKMAKEQPEAWKALLAAEQPNNMPA